ncbi:MAG TPA: DUF692 family protein [Candidatus Saccharimonadales bacterium]|jgi:uncharacterized protein (UPF0276 family)|nr:DUF692 family protein [Candidatus Saccharimonadales bacterium]
MHTDRVGIGWRPELAADILSSLDQIDVLELVASSSVQASRRERMALRLIARQAPVHIHGVDLGLAGSEEVSGRRLDAMARLIHDVEPEAWSEHLSFVRAGGHEIGHLAAPPRSQASVENSARNLRKAVDLIGAQPAMENIATLIQPPCSTLSESAWMSHIAMTSGCDLLLDLHNLYANSVNFNFDPLQFLGELPLQRVRTIHIAGGRWITSPEGHGQYLLDDHLHAVTGPVYELLAEVASRVEQPLTVILERDGRYPEMPLLLEELEKARQALHTGRQRAAPTQPTNADAMVLACHRR